MTQCNTEEGLIPISSQPIWVQAILLVSLLHDVAQLSVLNARMGA